MPRGVKIDNEELMNTFFEVVQNYLPFSLKINKNLKRFSELIFQKTHHSVSVSTLKRLFIYNDKTAPSLFTLDLICQTIGYKDWKEFERSQNQITDFNYREIITFIDHTGYKDFEEFKKLSSMFDYSNYQFDIILSLIKLAVQRSDKEVLIRLFELPIFKTEINYFPPQYYFAQDLGLILRKSDIILELIPFYAKSVFAQKWYIERFVDEDNLNGYYGEMLELYHEQKKTQEAQLFYHTMMGLRDVQNGIYHPEHFDYLLQFRETEPIFYVPKIRRIALLIVRFNDDKVIKESMMNEFEVFISRLKRVDYTYIALIFCNIVFYSEDYQIIKKAFELLQLNELKSNYNINLFRDLNMLKIYEAYVLLVENKPIEAKAKIDSFHPFYKIPYQQLMFNLHYQRINDLIRKR